MKSFFKLSIIILVLAISYQPVLPPRNAEAGTSATCTKCGDGIKGKKLNVGNYAFHKECFTCSQCKKQINGSFNSKGLDFYHPECFKLAKGLVCDQCGKILGKSWKKKNDKKYHPKCYKSHIQPRCDICGKVLEGHYSKDDKGRYHTDCYRESKLDRCVVCDVPLEGKFVTDVWGNHAHEAHDGKGVEMCESCGRILSDKSSDGGFQYNDGRLICGFCKVTAVNSKPQIESSRASVLKLLHDVGLTNIPADIPVSLVNASTLAKTSHRRHNGNTKGFTNTHTRFKNNKIQSMDHTIYILSGLPVVEFEGVLAHELLHVWLSEHQVKLSKQKTEGFCNLGTMLVNENGNSDHASILQERIETSRDRIYGKGYRKMKKQLDKYGWEELIRRLLD